MDQVSKYLGPPATASPAASIPAPASVWYYPLDAQRQVAVAITFESGVVERIEWLTGPDADQ